MYKIDYIDWKGRPAVCWLCAKNKQSATEMAMVMQGVYKIIKVGVSK